MGLGSLAASLNRAISPVVGRLLNQVRSGTAMVRYDANRDDPLATRTADGSHIPAWRTLIGAAALDVFVEAEIDSAIAKIWGRDSTIQLSVMIPTTLVFTPDMGFVWLSGTRNGACYQIVDTKPADIGGYVRVGLTDTAETYDD